MNLFRLLCWSALLAVGAPFPLGAADSPDSTRIELLVSANPVRPGETIPAGIAFDIKPKWHIYWRNPVIGLPPSIQWELPPGIVATEWQWPVPAKAQSLGDWNYVYEDQVVLPFQLAIGPQVPAGTHTLRGKLKWLECAEQCVPGSGEVTLTLTVGPESKRTPAADRIQGAQRLVPTKTLTGTVRAWWDAGREANEKTLAIEWTGGGTEPDFLPYGVDALEIAAETTVTGSGPYTLRKLATLSKGAWPARLSGVLTARTGSQTNGFEVDLMVAPNLASAVPLHSPTTTAAASLSAAPAASPATGVSGRALVLQLLGAFVGGLILNIMPCVLPVISLKIFSLVRQSHESNRRRIMLGLTYGAGVVASLLLIGVLIVVAQRATGQAGWGMQFQDGRFLVVITTLVVLISLNLFGLFEVSLPGATVNAAATVASREGAAGAFFNGVLAVVLATPCTAPFLGAAVGVAITSHSVSMILLTFAAVGVGLAFPFVLLSMSPALLKFMPKPGAWMEKFKIAMGFPMLATGVWLLSVTVDHFGSDVLWLGLFLVLVSMAAWVYGEFVQRGTHHRGFALALCVLLLGVGYGFGLEGQLDWRSQRTTVTAAGGSEPTRSKGIQWQRWSPQRVAAAQAAGQPVLVDFTAKWCTTCQVNKKTSLEIAPVRAKLKELNAVALLGDNTLNDPEITAELQRFGRAGVPLVLIYPPGVGQAPMVLPEVLTPSLVLEKLEATRPKLPAATK